MTVSHNDAGRPLPPPAGAAPGPAPTPGGGGADAPPAPAIEMLGIYKRFGPVQASAGAHLRVYPGEIHCLLGENGAGKSTLMKILYGLYAMDAGEIRIRGRTAVIRSPGDAMRAGIGMVHQHFMLVDDFTVAENVIAGMEPRRRGLIDMAAARRLVAEYSRRFGLHVDPGARVEDLSVGQQQRVEILKALIRGAEFLILDEPTAVLTPQEADELFRVMRQLKAEGKTIIFITHKLKETMAVADRVTVLRAGRDAGSMPASQTTPQRLAELMVGRRVLLQVPAPPAQRGPALLQLENVTVKGAGKDLLRSVNLQVRGGEILGIAGVEGNGQLELEEVVAGWRTPDQGRVRIAGRDVAGMGPRRRRRLGLAHIPSDRLRRGLAPALSVEQNVVLGRHWGQPYARLGVLRRPAVRELADAVTSRFDVRGGRGPVGGLSGGNQQKLVVGRELYHNPWVILACQPTRGVDVGAIERIHRELLDMRARGAAVLLISADLDELLALSDRLAVIYEGEIVAEGETGQFTEEMLGLLMAGQRPSGGSGRNAAGRNGTGRDGAGRDGAGPTEATAGD